MALGAGVGACGGDDSATANPDQDASINGGDGQVVGDGSQTQSIEVHANDVTVYVGQVARLDSSQTVAGGPITFAWSIESVPPGSAITSASLVNATSETPSFTPDIAGDYKVKVTAAAGGETGSKVVNVKAVNGMVFYMLSNGRTDPPYTEMHAVEMDGKNDHALNCRQRIVIPVDGGGAAVPPADAGPQADFAILFINMLFADTALDTWEGPAGTPPRAAFQNIDVVNDAGKLSLVAATPDNSCQKPPTQVHVVGDVPTDGGSSEQGIWQPRFSPDGKRIAYVEQNGNTYSIATVGFDGADFHKVSNYCVAGTSTCWGAAFGPRRPQWMDASQVGWVRVVGGTSGAYTWEIVKANDTTGATPQRVMQCTTAAIPLSFAFTPDGKVLANFKPTSTSAEDLVILNNDCSVAKNLTNLQTQGSFGRDFAISPDGLTVGFVRNQAPADAGSPDAGTLNIILGGELWVVPLDGSSAPHPMTENGKNLFAQFGPRFISGGSRLTWNGDAPLPPGYDSGIPDAGDSGVHLMGTGLPAMNVIKADGGGPVVHAAVSDPQNGVYVLGGGNGGGCSLECVPAACPKTCDMVAERKSTNAALLGSLAWVAALVFRRRNRKKNDD